MGGGIGMGNTCKPMAVSFQCMTKFTTNKKKKFSNQVSFCVTHTEMLQIFHVGLFPESWRREDSLEDEVIVRECRLFISRSKRILGRQGRLDKLVIGGAQSYPTLCSPMDCSLPGSLFHGILQARRTLEWVAILFSRGFS